MTRRISAWTAIIFLEVANLKFERQDRGTYSSVATKALKFVATYLKFFFYFLTQSTPTKLRWNLSKNRVIRVSICDC